MDASNRDLIDQIGRILVVGILIYITAFVISFLLSMFQMALDPILVVLLSFIVVVTSLALYYGFR